MLSASAILSVALSLPASLDGTETAEEFNGRMTTVAQAIAMETRDSSEAAAVLVLWHAESKFDRRIHAGETHPEWHQDHGKARCGLQLHRSRLIADWYGLAGIDMDSTRRCFAAGLRVLRYALATCGAGASGERRMALALQQYATGHCGEPSSESCARARAWARVVGELRATDRALTAGGRK